MTQYLLAVHTSGDQPPHMSEAEATAGYARIAALEDEMRAAGALLASGRLEESAAAAVVRIARGRTSITDGPFIESKEILGGFYIIDAPDREAALRWAEKTSACIDQPIEVRAFHGFRLEPRA